MNEGRETLSKKWRRFRRRPPQDRKLIFQAAVVLPLTKAGLRLFGFRRWKAVMEKFSPTTPSRQTPSEQLQREATQRAVRAVRSAQLHGPGNPNCLERSMTLWWMLRRQGVSGELHIGARKEAGKFEAHAWVELDGQVLNDGVEVHQQYARFDAPIAAADESSMVNKAASRRAGKAVS
jgi:hypothetical protein